MKLFVCSDLHINYLTAEERAAFTFPKADAYLIAGDLMDGVVVEHYHWLLNKTQGVPTYICPGNHDYYGNYRSQAIHQMRELMHGTHITVVVDEAFEIAPGLQLWASDFWTDMAITNNVDEVIDIAKSEWDDFNAIDMVIEGERLPLTPEHTLEWHKRSLSKLLEFSQQTDDAYILMTHHGLFVQSLARNFSLQPISAIDALYTSNLSEPLLTLKNPPLLAINGHVHTYKQQSLSGRTQLFSNPRGPYGKLRSTLVDVSMIDSRYQVSFV